MCFLLDTINSLPVEEKFSLLNGDYTFYSLIRGTFHKLKKASEKDRDVTETEDYWLTVKEFEKVVNKILDVLDTLPLDKQKVFIKKHELLYKFQGPIISEAFQEQQYMKDAVQKLKSIIASPEPQLEVFSPEL